MFCNLPPTAPTLLFLMNSIFCADISVLWYQFAESSSSLWAGGPNTDRIMTELPGWDATACRAPAVNEGLQPVVMINGLTLCHFIDFTSSAIFSCRFSTVKTSERIKEHTKTIWKAPLFAIHIHNSACQCICLPVFLFFHLHVNHGSADKINSQTDRDLICDASVVGHTHTHTGSLSWSLVSCDPPLWPAFCLWSKIAAWFCWDSSPQPGKKRGNQVVFVRWPFARVFLCFCASELRRRQLSPDPTLVEVAAAQAAFQASALCLQHLKPNLCPDKPPPTRRSVSPVGANQPRPHWTRLQSRAALELPAPNLPGSSWETAAGLAADWWIWCVCVCVCRASLLSSSSAVSACCPQTLCGAPWPKLSKTNNDFSWGSWTMQPNALWVSFTHTHTHC